MIRPNRLRLPAALLAWSIVPSAGASSPRPLVSLNAVAAPTAVVHQLGHVKSWRIRSQGHTDVDYAALARTLLDGLGQSTVATSQDVGGRQRSTYRIDAALHLRAVSIVPGGAVYVGRLAQVDARFEGQSDARTAELSAPFMVQVDDHAGIRAFRFPRQFPETLARTIQSLVTPLVVALPRDTTSSWVTDEGSSDGLYQIDHEIKGGVIHRTRRPVRTPNAIEVRQGQSTSTMKLDDQGHVASLEFSEDLTTRRGEFFVGRHVGSMTASQDSTTTSDLPETYAAAESMLADDTYARARLYEVEAHFAPRIEGKTAAVMVDEFASQVGKNAAMAHALLKNHVRRYPSAAAEVLTRLANRATDFDDPVVVVGFAAVSAAGHIEAQRALVDALVSSQPRTRERALISLMDLTLPEPFVLDAVWQTRSALSAKGPGSALSTSLATNVFGALGDVRRGNTQATQRVFDTLKRLLTSSDRGQRIMALDALANVGDFDRVAAVAAPFFLSADPYERVAAFSTFRRMEHDEAFEAFAARFAAEKDLSVLREAALVARDMSETPARNAWAISQLTRVSEPEVLVPIVRLVGDGIATHPDNTRALRELLATQKDRKVRKEIYAFVSPSPKGGAQ